MGKLSSGARNALPKSSFGLPGKRAYPMPDKSHAANAKARASQQVNKGAMSKATAAKIDAKADKILGESDAPAPSYANNKNAEGNRASVHFANMKAMGK